MDEVRSAMSTGFGRGTRRHAPPSVSARQRRRLGVWLALAVAITVTLFVSLNAWRARPVPLANTFSSPEALAEAVIEAMRSEDIDRLRTLALTEKEFRAHVWPDLPAARPERNVPFDFVWGRLQQNSEAHLRHTVAGLGDRPLRLRDVRFTGEASEYGAVVVHRNTQLGVTANDGAEHVVRLFGSTIEQGGRYKVFSYVVD